MSTYRMPADLAHVVTGGDAGSPPTVWIMRLPDGAPVALSGSAAVIWVVAADGDVDVAAGVADLVGRGVDDVAPDVERFLEELVSTGLLEVGTPSGGD